MHMKDRIDWKIDWLFDFDWFGVPFVMMKMHGAPTLISTVQFSKFKLPLYFASWKKNSIVANNNNTTTTTITATPQPNNYINNHCHNNSDNDSNRNNNYNNIINIINNNSKQKDNLKWKIGSIQ